MRSLSRALLFATSALALPTAVNAQDTAPAPQEAAPEAAPQKDSGAIADIVVTAQRRSENLTSVPLAISAQTGAALQASGITSISDVKFSTPGFIAQSGTGYTQIYIRGIGNGVYVGADPSVATFVDDIPHVYGSLVEDLVNVERVEILKGAQGGLYGRNASGGVVNIITKQPSDKASGDIRLTGGTRDTFKGSVYWNLPLSDKIAWNFSLTRNWHGPYRDNVAYRNPYPANLTILGLNANSLSNPTKLNNENVWSVDSKVRVRLTDNFKVTLAADYTDDHDASGNGWLSTTPDISYGAYRGLLRSSWVLTQPMQSRCRNGQP
jgi:iron complex outermembrane receptor protein